MARPDRLAPAAGSSRQRKYKVQPPRPPNAWILYRSFKFEGIRETNERISQAAVSKRISSMWRNETEEVKRHFERMADNKKAEHQQLYPDYRFSPQRREEKARAKEERKQSRLAKKAKARDATSVDTGVDADVDTNANENTTAAMMAPPPMPYVPHPYPYLIPSYQPNMVAPHPYPVHHLPEAHYGPDGPSPPISAAPSPAPHEPSESLEAQSYPDPNPASSSSSPFTQRSPSSESQASSSSSQLSRNSPHRSLLPSSHQPSPNPYGTQPLPTLLFQPAAPNEVPFTSPQVQFPSAEDTIAPAAPVWNNIPTQLSGFNSQHSVEVVNFDVPINHTQGFTQFAQSLPGGSSLESLQGMLTGTNKNCTFNLGDVGSSGLLVEPNGELEVAMGPPAPIADYNEELFADFDFAGLQQQMAPFTESDPRSTMVVPPSAQEDFQALFHTPNNPEVQAYTTARQRQPSVFTQDMMSYFNFEAAGASTEDIPSAVPPAPLPATVAPQQVRLPSTQHAAAMPIFIQMTNTPAAAAGTSYTPPAGAIYSSTRRVAGSWKPSFVNPFLQMEEPVQSWTVSQ